MKTIINSRIITQGKIIENKNVIFDHNIVGMNDTLPENSEIIDAKGLYLSSGFIDQHVHGSFGKDTMEGTIEALEIISKNIAKTGVTNFLPTTMTMAWKEIELALDAIRNYKSKEKGAQIIGAHFEGPFINKEYKGAQNQEYIIKPDIEQIESYLDIIKMITYAPELDIDLTFTKEIVKNSNTILSIGHSDCDMDLAIRLFEMGVKNITHCFNGMNGFHHRNPGIIGALFVKDFNVEYIADGIHSDLRMLRGFINKTGKKNAILITDAMRASMLKPGEFDLGGQKVLVNNDSARLVDGTLAGSILKLNDAVKNMISEEISLAEAIQMVTENPAKSLGIYDEIGSIEVGKKANFALFNEEIEIAQVYIEGKTMIEENFYD